MPPKKKIKIAPGQKKLCFSTVKPKETPIEIARHIVNGILDNIKYSSPSDSSVSSSTTPTVRNVVTSWFTEFPWLTVRDGKMYCTACVEDGIVSNVFVKGCANIRKSALSDHIRSRDHKKALISTSDKKQSEDSQTIIFSEQELGVCTAARLVHTIIQEDLAFTKYEPLIELLEEVKAEGIGALHTGDLSGTNYRSRKTAHGFLEIFANDVDTYAVQDLENAEYISVLGDESDDICTKKRLNFYVRLVDSDLNSKTRFLANVNIADGTGRTVKDAMWQELKSKNVKFEKIVGFGSDGASVMTGTGIGVTGLIMREHPHLINVHCIAHRLALCTSSAAAQVPAMKDFRETLISLFKYFKKSSKRVQSLEAIQETLEEPTLQIKRVHDVRWLSFYSALSNVHRSLEPLIVYLKEENHQANPKAAGLLKKVILLKKIL